MILKRIRDLCDKKNMTIRELEKKANLSNGTIGKWETRSPNVNNLAAVADVLDVTLDELVGRKETA